MLLGVGFDRTLELDENQVKESMEHGMKFSLNIEDCSIYIVTVPTQIDKSNKPDLTPHIK